MNPTIGYDIDSTTVQKIADLLVGKYVAVDFKEEAQLRELAFWRYVAYEGYAGKPPEAFREYQRDFMLGCYGITGWSIDRFRQSFSFELGCGPLGMIEFIPARQRYAYDPLNLEYGKLFAKLRSADIEYISDKQKISEIPMVDFGICFNVLDHTEDAHDWFNNFFSKIKHGGEFVLQVNTTRNGYECSKEHKQMHPSPLTANTILEWLSNVSSDFNHSLSDIPSDDNEFFFIAWGKKL